MIERTSIFSTPDESVADFQPAPRAGASTADIDKTTAFPRRQPTTEGLPKVDSRPTEDQPSASRQPMTYRTGRNRVISVKTTSGYVERFYALAEQHGWKANETFERAIEALEKASID